MIARLLKLPVCTNKSAVKGMIVVKSDVICSGMTTSGSGLADNGSLRASLSSSRRSAISLAAEVTTRWPVTGSRHWASLHSHRPFARKHGLSPSGGGLRSQSVALLLYLFVEAKQFLKCVRCPKPTGNARLLHSRGYGFAFGQHPAQGMSPELVEWAKAGEKL